MRTDSRDHYYRVAPTFPPNVSIAEDDLDQIPYMVDFANKLDLSSVADWLGTNW